MEAAMQFLRSNYVYRQVFRLIRQNFENIETLDFFSCCWQEKDLSVGRKKASGEVCCGLGRPGQWSEGIRGLEWAAKRLPRGDDGQTTPSDFSTTGRAEATGRGRGGVNPSQGTGDLGFGSSVA